MSARLTRLAGSLVLAASLSACATTRTISVSGVALDLQGQPVAGATVEASAANATGRTSSEADGRFTVEVTRRYSGGVLPASGVFVDPVHLTVGDGEGDFGVGIATALNVDDVAQDRAITIVVPIITILPIDSLCEGMDPRARYAFALAENGAALDTSAQLRAYREAGETQALLEHLSAEVRRAASQCGLASGTVEDALESLDRLFSASAS